MGSLRKNCKTPGCPNLHRNTSGYCDECMARYAARHPSKKTQAPRPTAQERGYDSKWRRFAHRFLLNHPVCAICGAPAVAVDHKYTPADVMLDVHGTFIYEEREYQALCASCNARKGKTEDVRIREQYHKDKAQLYRGTPEGGSEKNGQGSATGAVSLENCAGGKNSNG